jgi:diacylglycerol kinase (ATP)
MKRIIAAFFNSLAGLKFGLLKEPALRQEMALLALSLPVAPFLTLQPWKLFALWSSLLLLLAVEFLNTAVEKLADRVTRQNDELIKIAKDCGSAAVFFALIIAGMFWGLALFERLAGWWQF